MSESQETIFERALNCESENDRASYLSRVCASQPALRQEIESLLKAYSLGEYLETPAAAVKVLESTTRHDRHDAQIGPYKLLEQIGEGGMGTVYMAHQTAPVKRRVALKIIKPGMDSREVVARFEAERQALALMDHPNIARVLDGGQTAQGRPYFVMELVLGIPITDYCREKQVSLDERLKLFVDVCRAVQHAHQKGIIHRDLKPGNILVTLHDGVPVIKVIDFGVAKALHQELTERTLFTRFAQVIGTPLYMAPEQAEMSGLDIDTRADIYSLGVILYELLTGTTPLDRETIANLGFEGFRQVLREREPPRPSVRISTLKAANLSTLEHKRQLATADLARQVKGELDWVVMKALEKDRERRYESASALAADVERYRNREAVLACPPTLGYRLKMTFRRHRALMATAAMVATSLLLGTGLSLWQAVVAGQERDRAVTAERASEEKKKEALAAEAEAGRQRVLAEQNMQAAVSALEQLLNHVANPDLAEIPELQATYEQILKDALAFYDGFTRKRDTPPKLQYRAVGVLLRLGELANNIQEFSMGQDAYRRAMDSSDSLVLRYPDRLEYLELQARTYRAAGGFHMTPGVTGGDDAALKYLKHSQLLYERLSLREPANKEYIAAQVSALLSQVHQITKKAPLDPRIPAMLEQSQQLANRTAPSAGLLKAMADAVKSTDPDKSDELYRAAVKLSAASLTPSSSRAGNYSHAWLSFHAANQLRGRHSAEADKLYLEAVGILEALCEKYPRFVKQQNLLIEASNSYCKFLIHNGSLDKARDILERTRQVVGPQVGTYNIRSRAGNEFELGQYDAALADLKIVLERSPDDAQLLNAIPPGELAKVADSAFKKNYLKFVDSVVEKRNASSEVLTCRALILAQWGELEKAKADLEVALADKNASWSTLYATALLSLSMRDESPQENAAIYQDACRQMLSKFGNSKEVEEQHFAVWTCTLAPAAIDDFGPAIALANKTVEQDAGNQQYLNGLGAILVRAGHFEESQKSLRKSLKAKFSEKTSVSYTHYFLAMAEHHLGHRNEAKAHLQQANESADKELAESPSWNRKLTLKLLRKETEALLSSEE